MYPLGKLHEICLYGLYATIACLATGLASLNELLGASLHPAGFTGIFLCFLFWTSVLFVPLSIVGAFATKYAHGGEGLTFFSNNLFVIAFSHIAEDTLGLVLSPFWFLRDLFTHDFDVAKIVDYAIYAIELAFIIVGIASLL